ncbi:MAG: hypothetical protein ABI267_08805 [Ginsengibacter sp.]
MNRDKSKVTYEENIDSIPDGTFILIEKNAWLVFEKQIFLWSPFGYDKGNDLPDENKLTVLTPRSIINAFRAGYVPQITIKNK